jgi:hypothetical protein
MDEDEFEDGTVFRPNDGIIIEMADGDIEAGVLTVFSQLGIFFRSTHKMANVSGVSAEELSMVRSGFMVLNRWELYKMARELGVRANPLGSIGRYRRIVTGAGLAEYERQYGGTRRVLVERKKDVLRWVNIDSIVNITSSADYAADVELESLMKDLDQAETVPLVFTKLAEAEKKQ